MPWLLWSCATGAAERPVPPPAADSGSAPACVAAPRCELGAGTTHYLPLGAEPLPLVNGPQGGWHLELGLRVEGGSRVVRVLPVVRDRDTGAVLAGAAPEVDTRSVALDFDEGRCGGDAWRMVTVLEPPDGANLDTICVLDGAALDVELQVEDQRGRTARCGATITAALTDADRERCR